MQQIKKDRKSSVRMEDVAARAGVSVMTVSRALSTPDKVSEKTLKRVQAAVAESRYVPNELAGNLSSRRSKAVGLIIPSLNNSLYVNTIHAISNTLGAHGLYLMITNSGLSLENEEHAITGFLAQRVCALILHNTQHTERARELISLINVPTIEIGNLTREPLDQCVSYDNFAASKAMTVHLGRLGYRRIGFVSLALKSNERARSRLKGYLAGMEELGRVADRSMAIEAEPGLNGGADAMLRLLDQHPETDAIFFSADVMAVGALFECQRRGWSVPARIAIASFDDVDLLRHVVPTITTLRIPREEIGRKSAEMVIARLDQNEFTQKIVDVGFEIIQREST